MTAHWHLANAGLLIGNWWSGEKEGRRVEREIICEKERKKTESWVLKMMMNSQSTINQLTKASLVRIFIMNRIFPQEIFWRASILNNNNNRCIQSHCYLDQFHLCIGYYLIEPFPPSPMWGFAAFLSVTFYIILNMDGLTKWSPGPFAIILGRYNVYIQTLINI